MMPTLLKKRERPVSARPPPPKIKQAEFAEVEGPTQVNIHIDEPQTHDDNEFIVKAVEDTIETQNQNELLNDEQHGGLVSKILSTKRQMEGTELIGDNKPIEKVHSIQDIPSLRDSIQILCQSTNPLGKSLDYIQEDVDAMNKELKLWQRESKNYEMQALEQGQVTAGTIVPMQEKLLTIEKSIQEQVILALNQD
jgi:TRAF3-interacting protein 1